MPAILPLTEMPLKEMEEPFAPKGITEKGMILSFYSLTDNNHRGYLIAYFGEQNKFVGVKKMVKC